MRLILHIDQLDRNPHLVFRFSDTPFQHRPNLQFATDFGVGVGAVFTNIFYMPVKFVYATLGGITGGFAYVLTGLRLDIAKGIWVPSMGGTYVVTPSMLKGEDPIYFSGTTQPKLETRLDALQEAFAHPFA
jgi:hypothetical protein